MIKKLIKFLIYLIILIIIDLPLFLIYKIIFLSGRRTFTTISECLSLIPGYLGYFIRKGFYKLALKTGSNIEIRFGTILNHPTIKIEDDVYIGHNCSLGTVTIKQGTKIGSNVDILSGKSQHKIKQGKIQPTNIKNLKRITIGHDTWIGNSSVIMNDIGNNCIIGAGAVVTKPIPDNSVAVGNPARIIRKNA
jgi:acetyltransferase-like isoleucine patch superfamily enzyme